MDKKTLKTYLWLITFTIGLVLIVVHFETILHGVGFFLHLLMPLFIGIMIAFVLNRPYEWLRKKYARCRKLTQKTAKILAIITVYVAALGGVTLLICMLAPEIGQNLKLFAANADQYLLEAQNAINWVIETLHIQPVNFSNLMEALNQQLSTLSSAWDDMIVQIVDATANVASGIATGFISIVLSVYLLSGKDNLLTQVKRTLLAYLPARTHAALRELYQTVAQVFGDYVAGQCKEALILGLLCFVGMMGLQLDYAGLISAIIAVTALVPILGAYIGGAVGVILLLFVSPWKALLFLIFLVILQQVEGNLIYPRVVGRKIGLPGMWVLLGITVGGGLCGIWGMLLAVPITTVFYQLLKKDVARREKMASAAAE